MTTRRHFLRHVFTGAAAAGIMATAPSLVITAPALAQEWPPHPRGLPLKGLSIPLIERGRSRGVIRMDVFLRTTEETNFSQVVSNEVRIRNAIVSEVGSAMHARPSGSADVDLDFITAQIMSACRRFFGEGQVVGVLFERVIIRTG